MMVKIHLSPEQRAKQNLQVIQIELPTLYTRQHFPRKETMPFMYPTKQKGKVVTGCVML